MSLHADKKLRIVAADDMDLLLTGIQSVLAGHDEFTLVGVYPYLPELLDGIKQTAPDLLVVGDRIDPHAAPLDLVERLRAAAPRAKLLLLSTYAVGLAVWELFERGVHGYLFKSDPLADTFIPAIRAVTHGRRYLSPTASAAYVQAMQGERERCELDAELLQALRLLAEGCTIHEIAAKMGASVRHVYWLREKLRRRFGAPTNEVILSYARAEGFVT